MMSISKKIESINGDLKDFETQKDNIKKDIIEKKSISENLITTQRYKELVRKKGYL
jgi:hypothetical protein